MSLTQSPAWQALQTHLDEDMQNVHLSELFSESDPTQKSRTEQFSLECDDLFVDFSKNCITQKTVNALLALAEQQGVSARLKAVFSGQVVNESENRPALHTALRSEAAINVNNQNIRPDIDFQWSKMERLVKRLRHGQWRGFSGRPITDVVNIGVGGSDLGPLMMTHSLQTTQSPVNLHFISSIDGTQTSNILKNLNQETTLFIVASKSFTTIDTLSNADTAKEWLGLAVSSRAAMYSQHFIGISTQPEKMAKWGIPIENQLLFWDWVGGRYSFWSVIGLPIALQIGMDGFKTMLAGARLMDEHVVSAPLNENIPVMLGLIDVWNVNFLKIKDKAILPYDARLKYLPSYLAQLVMESNGKSVTRAGNPVDYDTCPALWGEVGPNAQHAFYQLLHQGTQKVMCDFIMPMERDDFDCDSNHNQDKSLSYQHELAMANCIAQSRVLMLGDAAIPAELRDAFNTPFKHYPGNQPSNTLVLKNISAKTMGMLIAMYEHKTYVESVIWDINPFDQWGVELGKLMAHELHENMVSGQVNNGYDSSTQGLMQRMMKSKQRQPSEQ